MDAARLIRVGLGGAGLVGAFKVGSTLVENTRRDDLLGDPSRELEKADGMRIEQKNSPLADKLTRALLGVGGFGGGGAGYLLLTKGLAATAGPKATAMAAAGALLFGAGTGLAAGALRGADLTSDTSIRPDRTPPTDGIAITTP